MVYTQNLSKKNELYKIICNFKVKTDHSILARREDTRRRPQRKSEKLDKYMDLARELKKL